MAALLIIAAALVGGVAAQPKLPYYWPAQACPPHPATLCDFYFDSFENKVPTFYLDDGLSGDHAIIPVMASILTWTGQLTRFSPGVREAKKNIYATTNTANATFLKYPDGTYDADGALQTFDQFYLNAIEDSISRLYARSWKTQTESQNGKEYYKNKCVFLPITAAYIHGTEINLNIGDKYQTEYPEERRCIVFKTQ